MTDDVFTSIESAWLDLWARRFSPSGNPDEAYDVLRQAFYLGAYTSLACQVQAQLLDGDDDSLERRDATMKKLGAEFEAYMRTNEAIENAMGGKSSDEGET